MSGNLYRHDMYIHIEPYDDKEEEENIFVAPSVYRNVKKYLGSNSAESCRYFGSLNDFLQFCAENSLILCNGVKYIPKSGDNK